MVAASINNNVDPSNINRIFVNISWSEPTLINCNSTFYTLSWTRDNGTTVTSNYSLGATQQIINNLIANTHYMFTVRLNTLAGPGEIAVKNITTDNDGNHMRSCYTVWDMYARMACV